MTYKKSTYECLQAHHSLSPWIPPYSPSLWKRVEGDPVGDADVDLNRRRNLLLPLAADLKSIIATSDADRQKAQDEAKKAAEEAEAQAQELLTKHNQLETTIAELTKLSPELLQRREPTGDAGVQVDDKYTAETVIKKQIDYLGSLRTIAVDRTSPGVITARAASASATPSASASAGSEEPAAGEDDPTNPTPVPTEPVGAFNLATALFAAADAIRPKGPFEPIVPASRIPKFSDNATTKLSEESKGVLSARGLNLTQTPINGKWADREIVV